MLILNDSKALSYLTICILYLVSIDCRDPKFLTKKSWAEFRRKRIYVTSAEIIQTEEREFWAQSPCSGQEENCHRTFSMAKSVFF